MNTSYTPPSPITATPTSIASNSNDVSTASVSKTGDVMMTSSSQKRKLLKKNSITPNKDPPEGRTTTTVAVMRGRPKHSHHRQCSNRYYKQKISACPVRLWFWRWPYLCRQTQTHAASLLEKAGSTVVEYFEWEVSDQTKGQNWAELLLNIPIVKVTLRHLILLSMTRLISHGMTLFLVSKPWKSMVSS